MLALRIEYLTGRCVATAYDDREAAEWPPHPARVFSALVATWAETEQEPGAAEERAALHWLEQAGAPAICASEASRRTVVPHYVPGNGNELPARLDPASASAAVVGQALAILPGQRGKQPRHFPSVTPDDPVVHLVWSGEPPADVRRALAGLVARVARIGHSSSLVCCALVEQAPTPTWRPAAAGGEVLRVPGPGQLEALLAAFTMHHGEEPRVLPARFERYEPWSEAPQPPWPRPVLDDSHWIVLRRVGGPLLPMTRGVDVAAAVRGALLKHAEAPIPELLSGHAPNGQPSAHPHLAIVPLAFVGHPHADGTLLGVALILPRQPDEAGRRAVLRAVGRWEEANRREDEEVPAVPVQLGAAGVLELERVAWGAASLTNLRPETWCRPARHWLSVTPVALDRHPGDLRSRYQPRAAIARAEAEATIRAACRRIGLPEPQRVELLSSVTWPGGRPARDFPPYPATPEQGPQRAQVHLLLEFAEPVHGPVLIGAGRYFGLGLFRPARGQEAGNACD